MTDNQHDITIDQYGVAEAVIEGTWQTIRLRASVDEDPDDSWLTIIDDKGDTISIASDVLEKALAHFTRFGQTGMLHATIEIKQDVV